MFEKLPILTAGFILIIVLIFGTMNHDNRSVKVKVSGWHFSALSPKGYVKLNTDAGEFNVNYWYVGTYKKNHCYSFDVAWSFFYGWHILKDAEIACK